MGNLKSSYYQNVKTTYPIESRYLGYEIYAVSDIKIDLTSIDRVKSLKIYYPNEMVLYPGKKYPLIIMVNGTGWVYEKYEATFKHLSSWGFIVIGNDDPSSGLGDSTIKTLNYMLDLNKDNNSIFYDKIDIEKIGLSGHSQGGSGVINAITRFPESTYFKCAYAASSPTKPWTDTILSALKYDCSKVKIPTMMTYEKQTPVNDMIYNFEQFDKSLKIIVGINKNANHGDMLVAADSYMTAWFNYILLNDKIAAQGFEGQNAEMLINNLNWMNVQKQNM